MVVKRLVKDLEGNTCVYFLKSFTNNPLMVFGGNLFTNYNLNSTFIKSDFKVQHIHLLFMLNELCLEQYHSSKSFRLIDAVIILVARNSSLKPPSAITVIKCSHFMEAERIGFVSKSKNEASSTYNSPKTGTVQ